jgi:hypothetical protein
MDIADARSGLWAVVVAGAHRAHHTDLLPVKHDNNPVAASDFQVLLYSVAPYAVAVPLNGTA